MQQQPTKHDVFISHSSVDDAWAQAALAALEGLGLRCWIAPRDILAGETWAGAIVDAIHRCRLMVLILSRDSNGSPQVTRELAQAAERGVHVLPLRVDDVQPSSDKAYYLGAAHWRTVLGGPTEKNIAQLLEDVTRLLELSPSTPGMVAASPPRTAAAPSGRRRAVVGVGLAVLALLSAGWMLFGPGRGGEKSVKGSEVIDPLPKPPDPEPDPLPKPPDPGPATNTAGKTGVTPDNVEPIEEPIKKPEPTPHVEPPKGPGPESERLDEVPRPDPERWKTAPASLRDAFEPVTEEWRETGGRSLPACVRHRDTGIVFLLVPGGRFALGAEPGQPDVEQDEHPVRQVELGPFYIARHETTVAQWNGDAAASLKPVVGVTHDQVAAWCAEHKLALPTEAQWEYAASGPENRRFPWGERWEPERCNSTGASDGHPALAPVGMYKQGASWCGAEDMAGNASEWCRGFYTSSYADFSGDVDPEPPARGSWHCARGGSCFDGSSLLRTSRRRGYKPSQSNGYIGFRCVFEP